MKKLIIILISSILLAGCQIDNSFKDDNKVEFTTVNKLPIVEGILNGKKAFFILDSGASISVLDNTQSEYYGFTLNEGGGLATGYGGNASFQSARNVILSIGGVEFKSDYKAANLSVVALTLAEDGIQIAGIIGSDIMKINKFIINYSDNSISLGGK